MKRKLMLIVMSVFITGLAEAQDPMGNIITGSNGGTRIAFKAQNPSQDKTDILTVTGVDGAVFTTSNTADGTPNSYNHNLRITVSLVTNVKSSRYQLVFYSSGEDMPYAAATDNNVVSVYFPVSAYESIKQKLDQSLAARKTVQLKVTQKTDGYREGTLVF
jgi:hypothetical protein